jgi:UPF0716 protein FxsA
MPGMPILLLFFFFAEIAVLIKLGQAIGGGLLLVEILATGALGLLFLRLAGRAFLRTNELVALIANPTRYFRSSGLSLILAGILLIVPGLLSDLVGLALFARFVVSRVPPGDRGPKPKDPDVIDVEYSVHDDESAA